jgi:hypothetical protein
MTRKDYEMLAAIISHLQPDQPTGSKDLGDELLGSVARAERKDTIKELTTLLCAALKADNPAFDRARFLKACGE